MYRWFQNERTVRAEFATTPDLTNPGFDSSAKNIDFTQYPSEDTIKDNIAKKQSNVRV